VDESLLPREAPGDYVTRLAREKALTGILSSSMPRPVLAADTAVVIDDEILTKPTDADHALDMLQRLSGRQHRVMTAVAVAARVNNNENAKTAVKLQISSVRFRTIEDWEAAAYVATGEGLDKAGAYAVQGLAAVFIERLEGSYSGVMGLPLFETAQLLQQWRIPVLYP